MKKFFVEYGCYLEKLELVVTTDLDRDKVSEMAYDLARECTDGWLGMHGFLCECYDEDADELSYGECCIEAVEEACYYVVTDYDEETHGDMGHEEVTW